MGGFRSWREGHSTGRGDCLDVGIKLRGEDMGDFWDSGSCDRVDGRAFGHTFFNTTRSWASLRNSDFYGLLLVPEFI